MHRRAKTLFEGCAIRKIGPLTNIFSYLFFIYSKKRFQAVKHFLLPHIGLDIQSKCLQIHYLASLLLSGSKITRSFTVKY